MTNVCLPSNSMARLVPRLRPYRRQRSCPCLGWLQPRMPDHIPTWMLWRWNEQTTPQGWLCRVTARVDVAWRCRVSSGTGSPKPGRWRRTVTVIEIRWSEKVFILNLQRFAWGKSRYPSEDDIMQIRSTNLMSMQNSKKDLLSLMHKRSNTCIR